MKFGKIVDAALIGGSAISVYMVLTACYSVGQIPAIAAGVGMGVIVELVLYCVS